MKQKSQMKIIQKKSIKQKNHGILIRSERDSTRSSFWTFKQNCKKLKNLLGRTIPQTEKKRYNYFLCTKYVQFNIHADHTDEKLFVYYYIHKHLVLLVQFSNYHFSNYHLIITAMNGWNFYHLHVQWIFTNLKYSVHQHLLMHYLFGLNNVTFTTAVNGLMHPLPFTHTTVTSNFLTPKHSIHQLRL